MKPEWNMPCEQYLELLDDDYVEQVESLVARANYNGLQGEDVVLFVKHNMKAHRKDIFKVQTRLANRHFDALLNGIFKDTLPAGYSWIH